MTLRYLSCVFVVILRVPGWSVLFSGSLGHEDTFPVDTPLSSGVWSVGLHPSWPREGAQPSLPPQTVGSSVSPGSWSSFPPLSWAGWLGLNRVYILSLCREPSPLQGARGAFGLRAHPPPGSALFPARELPVLPSDPAVL